jgi:hypothetical protein
MTRWGPSRRDIGCAAPAHCGLAAIAASAAGRVRCARCCCRQRADPVRGGWSLRSDARASGSRTGHGRGSEARWEQFDLDGRAYRRGSWTMSLGHAAVARLPRPRSGASWSGSRANAARRVRAGCRGPIGLDADLRRASRGARCASGATLVAEGCAWACCGAAEGGSGRRALLRCGPATRHPGRRAVSAATGRRLAHAGARAAQRCGARSRRQVAASALLAAATARRRQRRFQVRTLRQVGASARARPRSAARGPRHRDGAGAPDGLRTRASARSRTSGPSSALSLVRELAPVLTALMVGGRVGAGITASSAPCR